MEKIKPLQEYNGYRWDNLNKHAMENEKYYTPILEEFYIGFEYEALRGFQDGTVKTIEDYNREDLANNWNYLIVNNLNELPYVERSLYGKNAQNGITGIRVKYLDKDDLESLGFKLEYKDDNEHYFKYDAINNNTVFISKYSNNIIIGINKEMGLNEDVYFNGIIKNKSELKVLFKQLNIQ